MRGRMHWVSTKRMSKQVQLYRYRVSGPAIDLQTSCLAGCRSPAYGPTRPTPAALHAATVPHKTADSHTSGKSSADRRPIRYQGRLLERHGQPSSGRSWLYPSFGSAGHYHQRAAFDLDCLNVCGACMWVNIAAVTALSRKCRGSGGLGRQIGFESCRGRQFEMPRHNPVSSSAHHYLDES